MDKGKKSQLSFYIEKNGRLLPQGGNHKHTEKKLWKTFFFHFQNNNGFLKPVSKVKDCLKDRVTH